MSHSLADKLFNVKEKLTDQEYKELMDDVGKLNKLNSFDFKLYKVVIMEVSGKESFNYYREEEDEEEEKTVTLYTKQLDCDVKFYNSIEILHPSIVEEVNTNKGRFSQWSISSDNVYKYITKAELLKNDDIHPFN